MNPVPVSVCRALGARYVIAVNLNADMCGRGMQLQCTLEDGEAWFSNGEQSAQIRLTLLTNHP